MLLLVCLAASLAGVSSAAAQYTAHLQRTFALDNEKLGVDGIDDKRVDVDIAIFDTGADLEDPDLNVVSAVDCTEAVAPGYACDSSSPNAGDDSKYGKWHGTHVAEVAAALDNDMGLAGIAPGARLWAINNTDVSGFTFLLGGEAVEWDLAAAIAGVKWVTAHADQIEVAVGGPASACSLEPMPFGLAVCSDKEEIGEFNQAVEEMVDAGVVYVMGAGNFERDVAGFVSPGHPDAITVSAMADLDGLPGGEAAESPCPPSPDDPNLPNITPEEDDTLRDTSNWGAGVDITAPACATSGAQPQVAGAAALLASAEDRASFKEKREAEERKGTPREYVEAIREELLAAGNYNWTDDSGDGVKEPLLDLHDEEVFDPKTVPGADSPATDSDVNGDGRADLLTLRANGVAYVHPGGEDAKFSSGVASFSDGEGGGTLDPAQYDGESHYVVDVADVDGDRRSDLVTLSDDGDVHVYAGKSDWTFEEEGSTSDLNLTPALLEAGGDEPIAVADVTGGGRADLIAYNDQTEEIKVYPGRHDASFGPGAVAQSNVSSALHTGVGHYFLDAADVTGDRRADLVSMHGGDLNVFEGQGDAVVGSDYVSFGTPEASHEGEIDPAMNDATGYEPVGLADVTGDKKADLALVKSGTVYVYPGQSEGGFGSAVASQEGKVTSTTFQAGILELIGPMDINGDHRADFASAASTNNVVIASLGQTDGTFSGVVGSSGTFPSTQHFKNQNSSGNEFVLEKPSWRRRGCGATGCAFAEPQLAPFFSFEFGSAGSGNGQFSYPVGPTLDSAGNLWIADVGNTRLEKFNSKGEYLSQFGSKGAGNGQFNVPLGIAIDAEGNLWVTDTKNNRVQKFNSKGEYLSQFGSKGAGNGQFNVPLSIAIDPEGHLWVTDTTNNRVQKFNSKGEYLDQFGTEGSGNGQFKSPLGIAIDPEGHLWVIDSVNKRVQGFNSEGEYLTQLGVEGTGPGQFKAPAGITAGADGSLWITDTTNTKVQVWSAPPSAETEAASDLKMAEATLHGTVNPHGIATSYHFEYGPTASYGTSVPVPSEGIGSGKSDVEASETITGLTQNTTYHYRLVATSGAGAVHGKDRTLTTQRLPSAMNPPATAVGATSATFNAVINPFGTETSYHFEYGPTTSYGTSIPVPSEEIGSGVEGVIARERVTGLEPETLYHFRVVATSEGEPVAGQDRTFTTQPYEASFSFEFGSAGSGNGQFSYPVGPTLDSAGNLWIADVGNTRLEKFNSKGEYLSQFGSAGTGNGQFATPSGITIDSAGNIWVIDRDNNRVQKFNSKGEYMSQFGSKGAGNGQFNVPLSIAIDPEGHLWVTDTTNNRVQKFNSKGEYLDQFGTEGSGNGQFKSPLGIAIDPEGHLWVIDSVNKRVQGFNSEGEYLTQLGVEGTGPGQFKAPAGITAGADGSLWITDTTNTKVQVWLLN